MNEEDTGDATKSKKPKAVGSGKSYPHMLQALQDHEATKNSQDTNKSHIPTVVCDDDHAIAFVYPHSLLACVYCGLAQGIGSMSKHWKKCDMLKKNTQCVTIEPPVQAKKGPFYADSTGKEEEEDKEQDGQNYESDDDVPRTLKNPDNPCKNCLRKKKKNPRSWNYCPQHTNKKRKHRGST